MHLSKCVFLKSGFPLVHKDSVRVFPFKRFPRGSVFVWISQADVEEDLIPPEMNLRALFCIESMELVGGFAAEVLYTRL